MPPEASHPRQSRPSLSNRLRTNLQKAERVAVLAVGSDLRADDVAGLLAGRELQKLIGAAAGLKPVEVFLGGTIPENLTGPIRAFRPSHLILIDAADMDCKPGHVKLLDPEQVADSSSFSTHSLPLSVLGDYLGRTLRCQVLIVGIQPASRQFGQAVSPPVARAARLTARAILRNLPRAG